MKIVLCIFLLFITAMSVFGQSVELNGILGESVKFPAAVKKGGSLMYSSVPIGDVTGGSFRTARNEKFSGRLHWDSSTGLFSLSGLKLEDSGEYEVQNTDQNINTVFQLNVYIPVSKPHVSVTHDEFPCTVLCSVERGTEVTLSWHREGEEKPYVTSPVKSAPGLHLPVPVERSGTYTCEAKNSVSIEKASITVGAHCTAPGFSTGTMITAVISSASVAVVLTIAVFVFLYRHEAKRAVIYDHIRRLVQDQNKPPIVYDVVTIKSQGDEVQPESQYDEGEQAIKDGTDMSDRSDEPKNGTPQTGSYTINPQP